MIPVGNNWVFLSHVLAKDTPAFGGGESLGLTQQKCMAKGDSCNTAHLSFGNHLGSHCDAPAHFMANGLTIDDYNASDWVFSSVLLLDISINPMQLIKQSDVRLPDGQYELVLFRTGFEKKRQTKAYWEENPGFSADLADTLKTIYPSIRAIGFDSISLTSYAHREEGRIAHRSFLSKDIRIFEDLKLAHLSTSPALVIALPLRVKELDGGPVTVIALNS